MSVSLQGEESMKPAEIIGKLLSETNDPRWRHLYGVLGTYAQLDDFAKKLQQARRLMADRSLRWLT